MMSLPIPVLGGNNSNHFFSWVKGADRLKTLPNLPDYASLICNYNNDWTN